jgi:hypothetical protein
LGVDFAEKPVSIFMGNEMMKHVLIMLLPLVMSACGAGETVGVAAVETKAKAQEIEAGKQLEAQTKAQVEQGLAADQKNLQDAEAASH